MSDEHDDVQVDTPAVAKNATVDAVVAGLPLVLGIVVMWEARRLGAGWTTDGPGSGYFPFYIGVALLLSSGWVALSQLRQWAQHEEFAQKSQLQSVWAILWPMTVYVALIVVLGIYVPSVVLIAYFMLRHGKHKPLLTAAVALGVPLFFYGIFERWFLVPLPKGPLEAMLGL